jgi:hypothetical protein
MVRRAREQGLSLTGPDGLKQLTKTVLETALDQELTEHLGHEKNGPVGNETGNVRNITRQDGADRGQRLGGHRGFQDRTGRSSGPWTRWPIRPWHVLTGPLLLLPPFAHRWA